MLTSPSYQPQDLSREASAYLAVKHAHSHNICFFGDANIPSHGSGSDMGSMPITIMGRGVLSEVAHVIDPVAQSKQCLYFCHTLQCM